MEKSTVFSVNGLYSSVSCFRAATRVLTICSNRAVEYIYFGLLKHDKEIEQQCRLEDVENALRARLGDSAPQARDFARKILRHLVKTFPERTSVFVSTLDIILQKQLSVVEPKQLLARPALQVR